MVVKLSIQNFEKSSVFVTINQLDVNFVKKHQLWKMMLSLQR